MRETSDCKITSNPVSEKSCVLGETKVTELSLEKDQVISASKEPKLRTDIPLEEHQVISALGV
jgi:hypothetical protein